MGSIQNTVYYCCVSRGNQILYAYSVGDHEIENLAKLCLEKTPPFHAWYFETIAEKTFGFLIDDGYVYFTIVNEGLENPGILHFLEYVRDEFQKIAKKGSRGSFSGLNSIGIQDQLAPVMCHLITSLEHVSQTGSNWVAETSLSNHVGPSLLPNNANGQTDVLSSTKSPLLGKFNKQEKKKTKDHVVGVRDIESEEHHKSNERGVKVDSASSDVDNQVGCGSSISLQKDLGAMRIIGPGSQNIRKKWCHQVQIVLAIDAAVCMILFVIWLFICGGIGCIR